MMKLVLVLLALLLGAIPSAASAACDPRIDRGRAFPTAEYDPFDAGTTVINFTVSIRNRSSDACTLRLAVSGAPGTRFLRAHDQIIYTIATSSGEVVRNEGTWEYGVPVNLAGDGTATVPLQIRIQPGQIVRHGPYNDQLELDLFTGPGTPADQNVQLPSQVRVPARAQINVAGADSPFGTGPAVRTINFGDLAEGAERRVFIQLRSNTRATITATSERRGFLVNEELGPDARVPYTVTIDGALMNLAAGPAQLRRRPPLTLDGVNYEMVGRIGAVGERFAGTYRDTITLTVEPSE
jgi:spore coat protein U-like protein